MPLAGKCRTARAPTAALLAAVFVNLALLFLVLLQVSTLRTCCRPVPHITQPPQPAPVLVACRGAAALSAFAPAGTRPSALLRCYEVAPWL